MQVSEETKLLPCPFCGGEPEMIEAEEAGPNAMVICCRGCMASSKVIYALKDSVDDLLAEAWNTRATPAPAGDVGLPLGAIENGREFMRRLLEHYDFECEAGPLRNCGEFTELQNCFDEMVDALRTLTADKERLERERDYYRGRDKAGMEMEQEAIASTEAAEAKAAELEALLVRSATALTPLYNAVFNDNGDMTVTMGTVDHDDYVRGYHTFKAISATLDKGGL